MSGGPALVMPTTVSLAVGVLMDLAGLQKRKLERRPAARPPRHSRRSSL
jgi:hypothetical protein